MGIEFPSATAFLHSVLLIATGELSATPLPARYDAPAVKWTEGVSEQGYTYQTKFYVIISKTELKSGRVAEMAQTAEAVRGVLDRFPLRLVPEDTSGGAKGAAGWRGMHVIRIHDTHARYRANGGPPGSVGFYQPRTGEVVVSLERMIEPKGHRSNLEPRQRYRLLVHELVHQSMGERLGAMPMWMIEGFAEYFSACQFAPGRYRFDTDSRAVIDHLKTLWIGRGSREIVLPRISTILKLSGHSWAADNRTNPDNSYAKYAASLLLAHYQLQRSLRGYPELARFLKEDPSYEAVPDRPGRYYEVPPSQDPLWKGLPPAAVEAKLTSYWKSQGLDVKFVDGLKKPERKFDPFD